jgi:hypothetical protein
MSSDAAWFHTAPTPQELEVRIAMLLAADEDCANLEVLNTYPPRVRHRKSDLTFVVRVERADE